MEVSLFKYDNIQEVQCLSDTSLACHAAFELLSFCIVLGDKYINGEIIPCKYPTYQPNKRRESKYESRRYERRKSGPPPEQRRPKQEASQSESASGWGRNFPMTYHSKHLLLWHIILNIYYYVCSIFLWQFSSIKLPRQMVFSGLKTAIDRC